MFENYDHQINYFVFLECINEGSSSLFRKLSVWQPSYNITSYVLQYDLCCARHAIVAALTPGTNCSQGLASPSQRRAARPTIKYFLPLLLDIFTAVWENLTDLYGNEQ